jgi:ABC-type transport system involved in multi-copper enzyme maturation permease subunit
MFWSVLYRECREGFTGFSFQSAMAMLTVLVPLSGYTQAGYYQRVVADYELRQAIHQSEDNHRSIVLIRPVPPLLLLFNGIYDSLPDEVEMRIDSMSMHLASEDLEPLSWLLPKPYFSLIIGMLMTLMAVLFGYDSVSGEREQGTLKLIFSFPTARSTILRAKVVAVVLLISVNLAYALILYVLMIVSFSGGTFKLSATSLVEIAAFGFISLLTLIVFAALGIAVSAAFKHSAAALAVSVAIWAAAVIIWPGFAPYMARALRPVPSRQAIQHQMDIKEQELIKTELAEHRRASEELSAQKLGVDVAWQRYLDMNYRWIERKKEEIGLISAERDRQVRDRDIVARRLLSISPYGALKEALGILCGTGIDDYYLFIETAEKYNREEFIPKSFNFLSAQGPRIETRRAERLQLEPFELPRQPLKDRLEAVSPYAGLLIIEIGMLLLIGMWRFRRYDVR